MNHRRPNRTIYDAHNIKPKRDYCRRGRMDWKHIHDRISNCRSSSLINIQNYNEN